MLIAIDKSFNFHDCKRNIKIYINRRHAITTFQINNLKRELIYDRDEIVNEHVRCERE